jgi:hypothetical protein
VVPVEEDVDAHVFEPSDGVADLLVGHLLGDQLHAEPYGSIEKHGFSLGAPGQAGSTGREERLFARSTSRISVRLPCRTPDAGMMDA